MYHLNLMYQQRQLHHYYLYHLLNLEGRLHLKYQMNLKYLQHLYYLEGQEHL
jgi:hypothetical protein